ncbi:hypothetical protein HaLaN_11728 [Haematococcus lacustris]|uniref:Uncharacterized protein n=1 Tax=Haematococcus lacustris TaxID=44745 RepID=A0A699Z0G7_HAELA|nr:hypothetical protein HaLaN_11728 [Haematococcus lacustris]
MAQRITTGTAASRGSPRRVVAGFWSKLIKQAKKRWPDRPLALAYGAAGFSGSGSIGCRRVPVSQMLKEALRRVLMVAAANLQRVKAFPSPGVDVLNKQQHQERPVAVSMAQISLRSKL